MRTNTYLSVLILLVFTRDSLARFIVDASPVAITKVNYQAPERRAPVPAPMDGLKDPPECVTEDLLHYFDAAPKLTGVVNDSIISYGHKIPPICSTTSNRKYKLCGFPITQQWCGFTTAAPAGILDDYSSNYLSSAISFWVENSESISKWSASCPVFWSEHFAGPYYIYMASNFAECYLKNITWTPATSTQWVIPIPGFPGTSTSGPPAGGTTTPPIPGSSAGISATATATTSTSTAGNVRSRLQVFQMIMWLFVCGGYILV